jgi:hypothetical protein
MYCFGTGRQFIDQQEWCSFAEDFGFFLELAILKSCYNIDCRPWYRECRYPDVDDDGCYELNTEVAQAATAMN